MHHSILETSGRLDLGVVYVYLRILGAPGKFKSGGTWECALFSLIGCSLEADWDWMCAFSRVRMLMEGAVLTSGGYLQADGFWPGLFSDPWHNCS